MVTDGNCRRDGETPPDRVIEVNPQGQRTVFPTKVLNFGKQRSLPLQPIGELSALLLPPQTRVGLVEAFGCPRVRCGGGGPRD